MATVPMNDKKMRSDGEIEAGVGYEGSSEQAYNFRFVEAGDDTRSTIRSHVMRDYYEKKDNRRKPSTVPELSSAASKKEGVLQQTHRFKVGPEGLQEVKAGRKKNRGTSRATKNPSKVATNTSKLEDPQVNNLSSSQGPLSSQPELVNSVLSEPWIEQEDKVLSGPAATPDFAIGDALLPPQSEEDSRNIAPPDRISSISGATDPFNTLPILCVPRTEHLLHHAAQGILSSKVMGRLRTQWLSLATQDRAFFHVALSHYAGNYGLSRSERDPMEAVRFRMEAMKIINERLAVVKTALTDGTLGTVASLASYEATNGSIPIIRTHLKGLQRMVALRGGLQEPSINLYALRLVLWADLNCAIAMGTNPVFPDLEMKQTGDLPRLGAPTLEDTPRTFNKDTPVETLNMTLKENFDSLKRITQSSAREPSRDEIDGIRDSDTLYRTERSLLLLSNIWGPRKFVTSGCLAAIIYVDNRLRGISFIARIMDEVVERLRLSIGAVLEDISQHDLKENAARAILWALVVGAIASVNRPCRVWFVDRVVDFCDALDLQTWEEAETILNGFLWAPGWQTWGRMLWNEVEETRLKKYTILYEAITGDNVGAEGDALARV